MIEVFVCMTFYVFVVIPFIFETRTGTYREDVALGVFVHAVVIITLVLFFAVITSVFYLFFDGPSLSESIKMIMGDN